MTKPLGHAAQHALGLGDDLRSDPVAGEQNNLGIHLLGVSREGSSGSSNVSLCCKMIRIHHRTPEEPAG
jgi:hypothetical protein